MMLTVSHGSSSAKNLALLGALCLFLSAVEYMIPKPLPFLRIGLANLPLMLACNIFPLRAFLVLICIKISGQALITGTLFSYIFLFSMTGTFLSALLMFCLRRVFKNRISFIGIGTAGAVVSNMSQLSLAYIFIFGGNVRFIAPVFLASGFITGIILGVFCEIFVRKSQWYYNLKLYNGENIEEKFIKDEKFSEDNYTADNLKERKDAALKITQKGTANFYYNSISTNALFIAGFFIIPALVFNPSAEYRVIQFLFFMLLAFLCGKRINLLVTFFVTLFIIVFNLIIPYGQVLFTAGVLKITKGALEAGIHRAFTLQALIMLSKVTIRENLKLPGSFGQLLSRSLLIFSSLMNKKIRLTKGNFISGIDNLIINLNYEKTELSQSPDVRTRPLGYIVLIIIIFLSWLPWLFI